MILNIFKIHCKHPVNPRLLRIYLGVIFASLQLQSAPYLLWICDPAIQYIPYFQAMLKNRIIHT
ncbi:hypothetical protein FHS86_003522 [Roseimarinus sediminis]